MTGLTGQWRLQFYRMSTRRSQTQEKIGGYIEIIIYGRGYYVQQATSHPSSNWNNSRTVGRVAGIAGGRTRQIIIHPFVKAVPVLQIPEIRIIVFTHQRKICGVYRARYWSKVGFFIFLIRVNRIAIEVVCAVTHVIVKRDNLVSICSYKMIGDVDCPDCGLRCIGSGGQTLLISGVSLHVQRGFSELQWCHLDLELRHGSSNSLSGRRNGRCLGADYGIWIGDNC